jgi:predicted RNA methylase
MNQPTMNEDLAPESAEAETPAPLLSDGEATYDPADDKIRIRVASKMPRELYDSLKAIGFAWAPKQGAIYATWTPEREDRARELVGEIGDEDSTLVDRAEARAERFETYAEHRGEDAARAHASVAAIADNIPFGQPILVGHHSERHARRDAKRIETGMRKAIRMWETGKYWEARAEAALRHARYKELPAVRFRRIKTIETDKRREEKIVADAEGFIRLWSASDLTFERALKLANFDHVQFPAEPGERWGESLWGALDKGKTTPELAAARAIEVHERRIARANRWIAHCDHRLAYERVMLGESGGIVTHHHDVAVGGKVRAKHWRTSYREEWLVVKRVSVGASGEVQSVSTPSGVIPIECVKGYEAPTAENVAKVKEASKLPPLVNFPGEGFVVMTRAQWDRRAADEKKAHHAKATETHGAYRYRQSWVPGGSYRTAQVFLSDAKIVERPALASSVERVTFEREIVLATELRDAEARAAAARAARVGEEAASLFAQMKAQLQTGGVVVVQADQLFPTPDALADRIVAVAGIQNGHRVLEPSAGTGAIVRAIRRAAPEADVTAWEINAELARASGATHMDFLLANEELRFDRVAMNPPFAGGADIVHVTRAFGMLKSGGRLVAVMGGGVEFRQDAKTKAFRELVASTGGTIERLPDGSFESAGTNVRTVIVQLDKP